ncbi:hypothetical protein MAR_024820 [Mya arenaria]|uniref:TIR domain-containing protein n=1 Tax=Mya arenaria TaxID=6604 RepID=A0ABY7DRW7_MYAAR|nr:hypothetical protein MAR_024820 [Mya arenaria]
MGRPRLGEYIRAIDFLGSSGKYEDSDDDPGNKLIDYERLVNNDDSFNLAELKDGFAAFREKVCVPNFPGRHSGPYWVAYSTICVLDRLKGLSGKELGEVFQKMKISYSYDSSDTDDERVYADFLHDGIVMIFKSINEGQCSGCQNEFLDLYGFYEGLLPKMSEIMRRYLGYTIRDMRSVFPDKNPFLKPNLKVFDATVNFVEDILASTKHDGDAEDRKDNDVSKPKTNVEALLNLWIVLLKTEQKSYVYRVYDIAGNDEYAKVIVWKEHLEHAKAFLKTISKVRYHDDTKRYYGDIMKALLESWKKGKVLGMLQKELVDFIFDCLMDESSDKEGLAEDVVDKFFVMTKKDGDLGEAVDVETLLIGDGEYGTIYLNIFAGVIMKYISLAISSKDVGKLLEMGLSCTPNLHSTYMAIVLVVARNNPSAVAPHFQKLKNDKRFPKQTKTIRVLIVVPIALCNENLGREGIDFLMSVLSPNDLQDAQVIVSQLSLLAKKEQEYIQKYRPEIEKLQSKTGAHDLKQSCEHLLNVIDGKGLDDIVDAMEQQQMVVTDLETKVGATINTVVSLGDHVLKQGEEIATLTTNVDQIDERVNEVETDLSDTKLKIEEIDNKTITSAPKWSRDLTKLMNPKSSNDWRLLASRLGYKNDDIRAWSQHHDPCMGLLKDVVEDEDFEYPSPPPIFLSYQWGIQNEVKLLKQHLQMAGYECWMDIGQMGGGDKLFEKIDNGIRGAKVIVSCTTEKYAKSPNCNREVNLSVNLGKPIIPLLMEKMAWPPKGSMGPIFSEYLFIRSFQRSGEETDDQRFWPVAKFQELLMQLNFYAVPNESLISKDYKNWWIPIVEEIKIDKKKDVKSFGAASNPIEVNSKESPVVFLSYQWGRQTQVKGLYECLTSLGYSVWMDIFQMGGGDSLYDKIDRGIRGCKVVVSCVTPKYALSANCRREMSLADALKKPIIPLLLEQTKWPPDGPMSMVFTELLFINVYRDENIQKTWTGPKIEELVSKLKEHVQVKEFGTQSDKKEVKSTSNESAHESQPIKPIEQNAKNEIEKTPNTASKASTEDKKQVTENAETETPIPGKQITSVEPLKQNAPVVEKKAGTESKIVVKKSESKLPPSTQKSSSCSLL